MDIVEIFRRLPPDLSRNLQLRLEDQSVSTHLLKEEALEIVTDIVRGISISESLTTEQDTLLWQVPEAVITKIFG
jgi:hypothetical protein